MWDVCRRNSNGHVWNVEGVLHLHSRTSHLLYISRFNACAYRSLAEKRAWKHPHHPYKLTVIFSFQFPPYSRFIFVLFILFFFFLACKKEWTKAILPIISPRWQRERGMGEKNRICRLNRGYERRGGREKRAKGGLDEALSCIERCTRKWEAVSRRPWGLREKHFTRKDHPCRVTAGLITGGGRSGEANARNRER